MSWIDVRPLLPDPSDAESTTVRIDEIGEALVDAGGGTLFLGAGDYHLMSLANTTPARADPDASRWLQGGICVRPGLSLVGERGTRLVWDDQTSPTEPDPAPWQASVVATQPLPETATSGSGRTTITDDVVAGTTTFVVVSTSGFEVGRVVLIRLGLDPVDATEALWWCFAGVEAKNDGTPSLTLSRPAQIPFDTGGSPPGMARWIRQFGVAGPVQQAEISGLEITVADPERCPTAGVRVEAARDLVVANISGADTGEGLVVLRYCQNVAVEGVHVHRARAPAEEDPGTFGRGVTAVAVQGVTIDGVWVEAFDREPVHLATGSRGVRARALHLTNSAADPDSPLPVPRFDANGLLRVLGGTPTEPMTGSDLVVEGLLADGYGGAALTDTGDASERVNSLTVHDLDLRMVPAATQPSEGSPVVDLDYLDVERADQRWAGEGRWRHDQVAPDAQSVAVRAYAPPRVWARVVPLTPDAAEHAYRLPDGTIRRGRAFVSAGVDLAELDLLRVGTATDGVDLSGEFADAGTTIELPVELTEVGLSGFAEQPLDAGDPEGRYVVVEATTDMPQGQYAVVQLEYFPIEAPGGSRDDHDGAWFQVPTAYRHAEVSYDGGDIALVTGGSFQTASALTTEIAADPGDVLYATPNFKLNTASTPNPTPLTVFDLESGGGRWSDADQGYSGWRASGGQAVNLVGGVTHTVVPADIDDGMVTVAVVYQKIGANSSNDRHILADGPDEAASLTVVNLGHPLELWPPP